MWQIHLFIIGRSDHCKVPMQTKSCLSRWGYSSLCRLRTDHWERKWVLVENVIEETGNNHVQYEWVVYLKYPRSYQWPEAQLDEPHEYHGYHCRTEAGHPAASNCKKLQTDIDASQSIKLLLISLLSDENYTILKARSPNSWQLLHCNQTAQQSSHKLWVQSWSTNQPFLTLHFLKSEFSLQL